MNSELTGRYRGKVAECVVGVWDNENALPFLYLAAEGTEKWNPQTLAFEPALPEPYQYENRLTLYSKEGKECIIVKQAIDSLGWDGTDFGTLNVDMVGKQIQFIVEAEEYKGKTQLKINFIYPADSNPDRTVKPLEVDKLKALNTRFGLKAVVRPPVAAKPMTAVRANPTAAPNAPTAVASVPTTVSASATTAPRPRGRPAKKPVTSVPAARPATEFDMPPAECTRDEAYAYVYANKGERDDGDVVGTWADTVEKIGDGDEEKFTPTEWATVRDTIMEVFAQ